jgi:hypothetical protein
VSVHSDLERLLGNQDVRARPGPVTVDH